MATTLNNTIPSKIAIVTHDLDTGKITYTDALEDVETYPMDVGSIGGWVLPSGELVSVVEKLERDTYGDVLASNIIRRVYSYAPGGVLEKTHETITHDVRTVYPHGEDSDGAAGGAVDGEYVDRILIHGNYSVEITRGILQVVDLRTHEVRGTFDMGYRIPWAALTQSGNLVMFRSAEEGDNGGEWYPDAVVSYSLVSLEGNSDPLDFEEPSYSTNVLHFSDLVGLPEIGLTISGMFTTKDYVVVCYDLGMFTDGHEAIFDLYDASDLAYVDTIEVGDVMGALSEGYEEPPPLGAN